MVQGVAESKLRLGLCSGPLYNWGKHDHDSLDPLPATL